MKIYNPAHPSEIILEYFLHSPDSVISSGKANFVKSLILNKTKITEEIANTLAGIFITSQDFWLNLQKQYNQSLEKPLKDMSINCDTTAEGLIKLGLTKQPICLPSVNNTSVYMLTEQAYKYMLSKCTEDEAWDLGWLGQSEKHCVSKPMSESLKNLINKSKV